MRLTIRGSYPADWRAIAERVKAEAGNRCIRCGHPDGPNDLLWGLRNERPHYVSRCDDLCQHAYGDGKQRMLTVHHLDGDKSNCRWWNLLALCQACHLSIQARVIPERPWLWSHSAWFRPYVAGFYASYYGGQEITRAEALADMDRWLALNPALAGATPEAQ